MPADSLAQAERIARARKVNLSVVVSEALSDGWRMHAAAERSEQVLNAYKKAFIGFSGEEMMVLDGVVLEPAPGIAGDKSRMGSVSLRHQRRGLAGSVSQFPL